MGLLAQMRRSPPTLPISAVIRTCGFVLDRGRVGSLAKARLPFAELVSAECYERDDTMTGRLVSPSTATVLLVRNYAH